MDGYRTLWERLADFKYRDERKRDWFELDQRARGNIYDLCNAP